MKWPFISTLRAFCGGIVAAVLVAASVCAAAGASDSIERVEGFFCDAKSDQIAFLLKQAEGHNEIMAANAVNKSIARQSCARYLPLDAIPSDEEVVVQSGLVFKMQRFIFLPENAERWSGTVFGSLKVAEQKRDI